MFEEDIARLPVDPPRVAALLPGLRISSAISRASLILPIVFVALFALLPLSIAFSDPQARLTLGHTEVVDGRIVTLRPNGCRGQGHQITYTFSPPTGVEYRATASLCPDSPYYELNTGDRVPVKYLASDPAINAIADASGADQPPFLLVFLFPIFALLMFLPAFVSQLRPLLRARHLFQNGRIVLGSVVFVKRKTNSSWWPGWPASITAEIYVTYRLPAGNIQEAKAWCDNDWFLNQLQPGGTVHIAVLSDRPNEAALLDAFVR